MAKLRQVDVLAAQGTPAADAIRSIGVTEVTSYRWRREFGGLESDHVRRMKAILSMPVLSAAGRSSLKQVRRPAT